MATSPRSQTNSPSLRKSAPTPGPGQTFDTHRNGEESTSRLWAFNAATPHTYPSAHPPSLPDDWYHLSDTTTWRHPCRPTHIWPLVSHATPLLPPSRQPTANSFLNSTPTKSRMPRKNKSPRINSTRSRPPMKSSERRTDALDMMRNANWPSLGGI